MVVSVIRARSWQSIGLHSKAFQKTENFSPKSPPRARRDGSAVESTGYVSRGHEFNSQYSHGSSQINNIIAKTPTRDFSLLCSLQKKDPVTCEKFDCLWSGRDVRSHSSWGHGAGKMNVSFFILNGLLAIWSPCSRAGVNVVSALLS